MYPVIFKEANDQYVIMDVHYKGIWKFERKYLLLYLSILKSKQELAETWSEAAFEASETAKGVDLNVTREALDFVLREKMPLLSNFDPSYLASLLDDFGEGIITPPTPVVEVTSSCSYRCPWCYVMGGDRGRRSMTSQEFQDHVALPMISKFGVLNWCLTGGEPTLDMEKTTAFAGIITRTTEKILGRSPLRIFLLTNGYNLERNAHLLLDAGINAYQVSLASPIAEKEAALRRPRQTVDSYAHAVNGIKRLKALGAPVEINMVVQPRNSLPCSNIDDIDAMFALARDLHVDRLRIIPAVPAGKALENGIFFTREDYDFIRVAVRRMRPLVEKEMAVDCPIDKEIEPDRSVFCGAATLWLYVNHQGDTFPCNNLQHPECRCSEGFSRNAADVWTNSNFLKELRDYNKISIHDECIGCADRVICAGDCRALCHARYHSFDLASKPAICFKYQ